MRYFLATAALAAAFLPVAARGEALHEFCADRPGLGTPACTMDKGHVAIELGLAEWSLTRGGGEREDEITAGDFLLRYGLGDSTEVQVGWTGYIHQRERTGNVIERRHGTGDLLVAVRQNLHNPDGSGFSAAIMPYATLPVGNDAVAAGDWGAGVIVPLSWELPHGFGFALTAEADAAPDEDQHGRHLAYSLIAGLEIPVAENVGGGVELSAARDRDPGGHTTEVVADFSLAWTPNENLQFDVGADVGLNHDAADLALSVGVAKRF